MGNDLEKSGQFDTVQKMGDDLEKSRQFIKVSKKIPDEPKKFRAAMHCYPANQVFAPLGEAVAEKRKQIHFLSILQSPLAFLLSYRVIVLVHHSHFSVSERNIAKGTTDPRVEFILPK